MSRSSKKSLTIPHPIREGLESQRKNGILDYPSENAAYVGLARYQLLVGKPHPITAAIARMHPDDQDCIDDFLLEISEKGLSLKGQFLTRLVELTVHKTVDPSDQEITVKLADEILILARRWACGEDVFPELKEKTTSVSP